MTAKRNIQRVQRSLFRAVGRLAGVRPRAQEDDFSLAVPFAYDTGYQPSVPRRIAAICHIFYIDLAEELLGHLRHLPQGTDLYVSTTDEAKAATLREVFADWSQGTADVRVAPNRGRDVAPKFVTFRDVYTAGYEFVVFLHSKKTNDPSIGPPWRLALMHTLLGSAQTVGSILAAFDADPRLGMVIPQHFEPIREHSTWQNNFLHGRSLAKRMGFTLKPTYPLDFAGGSMFWARPEALEPLLGLHLQLEEFPEEGDQIDDTIAHGIERLVCFVCEFSGYDWAKIADPSYFHFRSTILPVKSPEALGSLLAKHRFHLLPATVRTRRVSANT